MIGFSTYLLFWLKKFNNSPCFFPGDGLGLGRVSICWEDPGLEFIVHGLSCSAHLVFCFGQQTGLVSFSCLFYPLSLVYLCLPSLLLVLHHGTIPPYSVLLCPTTHQDYSTWWGQVSSQTEWSNTGPEDAGWPRGEDWEDWPGTQQTPGSSVKLTTDQTS